MHTHYTQTRDMHTHKSHTLHTLQYTHATLHTFAHIHTCTLTHAVNMHMYCMLYIHYTYILHTYTIHTLYTHFTHSVCVGVCTHCDFCIHVLAHVNDSKCSICHLSLLYYYSQNIPINTHYISTQWIIQGTYIK